MDRTRASEARNTGSIPVESKNMTKPKILVIVGPTSSGKSDLAVKLAKRLNGEVISADSRQVYRGLNIGSGKITEKEKQGVPHHLLDVASPRRAFSVVQYQKLANKKIEEILKRKRLPIIVGGTGFYIQAIVDGLVLPEVKPDHALRSQLSKLNKQELFNKLRQLDPARAETIDKHNPRRLIRAIEIAETMGQNPKIKKLPPPYEFVMLGIKLSPEILQQKIKARLRQQLKLGLIKEVEELHQSGLSWQRLESLGLEYKYLALYLQNKITKTEMIGQLSLAIWQYAKRQLTWFKRDQRIIWLRGK